MKPEDGHVVRRGFILLPCRGASVEKEETHLNWFHREIPLAEKGDRHLILQDGSLLLANVRPSQTGSYSCQVSNKYGNSTSIAQVSVSREYALPNGGIPLLL